MEYPATFTAIVILIGMLLFASGRARMDLVAVSMVLALHLGGILDLDTTLSGFAAPATITLAAIFVLSGAMRRSGTTVLISHWMLRLGRGSRRRLSGVLFLTTSALSAVMLNLAAMVIMLPVALRLSRSGKLRAGKILMPLGLFSMLGGYLSLLGTTPNLIVSDLLAQRTGQPFSLFEPGLLGWPILGLSLLWVLRFGQNLLPNTSHSPTQSGPNFQQLERTYGLDNAFYKLRVRSVCDLVGQRLANIDLRHTWHINIVGIAPPNGEPYRPWSDITLEVNDEIIVRGNRADVLQMASLHGLEPKEPVRLWELARLAPAEIELAEVLVPPYSTLVGHTLASLDMHDRFGLNVLAILRGEEASAQDLLASPLQSGDRLLVEGSPAHILNLRQGNDLVVLSDLGVPADELVTARSTRMLIILGAAVLISITGLISLPIVMLIGALATILSGCTTAAGAYEDIDWSIVVLVAALLPLGSAMESSGLSTQIGTFLATQMASMSPYALLAALFFVTVLLTQFLSNAVLALVITPVAFDIALPLGISAVPVAMTVLFAVSTSFLTPISELINLLVREPGGYRWRDYLFLHGPVIIIIALAVIFLAPVIWPF